MTLFNMARQILAGSDQTPKSWKEQHPAAPAQQSEFIVDQSQLPQGVIGGEAPRIPVDEQTRHILGAAAMASENQPGE